MDANHAEIVAALRKVGCKVVDLSGVGKGVPDLLVADRLRRFWLVEVKDGSAIPSKRKLNKAQVKFHAEHADCPIAVVTSVAEALRLIV